MNDKTEIILDLRRSMATLGAAEGELAWKKVAAKHLTSRSEITEALREEVRAFRDAFLPTDAVFTSDEWRRVYNKIDQAAARELSESANRVISDLEHQKQQVEAEIIRQQTDLDNKYRDFDRIKDQAEKAKTDYAQYAEARSELASAEAEYERVFEARCTGKKVSAESLLGLAELIATRPLRLRVVEKLEAATKKQIFDLQRRNKELARELGLTPHAI
jgi:hypothetical protein